MDSRGAGNSQRPQATRVRLGTYTKLTLFNDYKHWPNHLLVVPEYAFSVEVTGEPTLSLEHSDYCWCDSTEAPKLLKYDSNKIALWELCERLKAEGKRIPRLERF
jgi:dATP pyrophosphohydrolase